MDTRFINGTQMFKKHANHINKGLREIKKLELKNTSDSK